VVAVGTFFPQDFIETVREQVDLVEVASEYLHLTRRGKDYVALCPFHQEKTPSFTVSREKQIFHCFGCGTGGNVFHFLMAMENLTFPEAVRQLAERAGLPVPVAGEGGEKKARLESRILEMNALARDFYGRILRERPEGAPAREYLAKRGLTGETALLFGLGYAPDAWDSLTSHLRGQGYTLDEILAAGLAVAGERGRPFDRFRRRVIFPIHTVGGKIAGFGGRILGEGEPKYLNSPETPVFNKREVLYGLDRARQAIKELGFAVIMEGYMDVLTAHQAGITNAVGSLGTSLTFEQGRLLRRYTTEAVIAYDADAAGVAATLRGLDMLQELGYRVKVVTIPEGKDPDEYIRNRGRREWDALVEKAPPLVEYRLDQACRSTGDKQKILAQVLPSVAKMASPLEQEEAVKLIAARLNVSWEAVKSELRRINTEQRKKWPISDKIANKTHNIITDAKKIAEREIFRLILQNPGYLPAVKEELGERFYEKFADPVLRRIIYLFDQQGARREQAAWLEKLEAEERKVAVRFLMEKAPFGDSPEVLRDFVGTLKARERAQRKEYLLRELARAEKNHDSQQVRALLEEINRLFSLS
jgi:DNA primase